MRRHSWIQVFLLPSLISVAFHGCALIVIASSQYRIGLPARWINQSLFAVTAMLAASLFGRKKPYYPLLLILRFILLMVLSAPASGNYLLRMALILPFISDLLALAPRKWISYVFAATSVGIAILAQQRITAWGMQTPVPDSSTMLLAGLISGGWIVLTASASHSQKKSQLLGLEIERLNSVIDRLTDANVSFQNYARGVVDVTIQQERLRISKDIHDTVGYTFTNVRMLIEACIAIVGRRMPKVLELLQDAKNQSLDALAEVRRELGNMRNYHAEMLKLPNAMKKIGEMFEKATGVRVNIELTELPWEQSTQAEMAIYHLVQEGLTNAFRHGKATEVTVLFRNDEDSLLTIIRDNGEGASEITEGIGLKGMNERFQELGGDVTCGSVADGFELRATLRKKIADKGTNESHSRLVG